MGIAEIGFYFLLEIQASFFQAYGFFKDLRFRKKIFFKFRFQVSQKNVQVVSLYTHFQGFFLLKVQKECVYVIMLKIILVHIKNYVLVVKKGISKLSRWVAQKSTAFEMLQQRTSWYFKETEIPEMLKKRTTQYPKEIDPLQ